MYANSLHLPTHTAQVVPLDEEGQLLNFAWVLRSGMEAIRRVCLLCGLGQQPLRVLTAPTQNMAEVAAPFMRDFGECHMTFPGTHLLANNAVFQIMS